MNYDFRHEAQRVIDAIEPRAGATMTVMSALREAFVAGRDGLEPVWNVEPVHADIAEGQLWRAPDGRLLRVVSLEDRRIGVRNAETDRLTYMQRLYFDPSQRWHLTRVTTEGQPADAPVER